MTARVARPELAWGAACRDDLAPLRRRCARKPRDGRLWAWRGKAAEESGCPEEARECYERAAALSPQSGWIRALRGRVWHERGDPRGLEELILAARLAPDFAPCRAWLGAALRGAGRHQEAEAELSRALELMPCYEVAHAELARLRGDQDRWEEAAESLARAFEGTPKFTWERFWSLPPRPGGFHTKAWAAWWELRRGRVAAAEGVLGAETPGEPSFLGYIRAEARAAAGGMSEAIAALEPLARACPGPTYRAATGLLRLKAGDPAGAARDLAAALGRNGAEAPWLCGLGEARLRQGRTLQGRRHLERALELDPNYARAQELLGRRLAPGTRVLDVFLNYACQAKCPFCFNPPLTPELIGWKLPFERLAAELVKGRGADFEGVTFSGGEVTLLKELPRLLRLARRARYAHIGIITNGLRLADASYADELVDAGLNFACVSVHGPDAALHDRMVRVPGAFEKVLAAMGQLQRRGVPLVLNYVLTRENAAAAAAFVERFVGTPGLAEIQLYFPHYDGLMAEHADTLGLRLSEAAGPMRRALSAARRSGAEGKVHAYNMPPCALPQELALLRNWEAEPESLLLDPAAASGAALRQESRGRVRTEACSRCGVGERCLGFESAYARRYGTAEMKPLR